MQIKNLILATTVVATMALTAIAKAPKGDIVDTAVAAGSFKTLVKLVQAADLVDTLKSKGPFTVLAPTDAAFGKVPKALMTKLGADQDALRGVLTYHVISGNFMAADVVKLNGKSVKTVNGAEVKITVKKGKVYVNNVEVIKTDIKTSNGVIHVLKGVLLPPKTKMSTSTASASAPCTSCPSEKN